MKKEDLKVQVMFDTKDVDIFELVDAFKPELGTIVIEAYEVQGINREKNIQTAALTKIGSNKWQSRGKIQFKYIFTRKQIIEVSLTQQNSGVELKASFLLPEIFLNATTGGHHIVFKRDNGQQAIKFHVRGIEIFQGSQIGVFMNWQANNLVDKGSFFKGSTNPFLKFLKGYPDGAVSDAGRTETIYDTTSPKWETCYEKVSRLFDFSMLLPFAKVQCWHQESKDKQDLIGEVRLQYRDLIDFREDQEKVMVMIDPKNNNSRQGNLVLRDVNIDHPDTILTDFEGGLKLAFTSARCLTSELSLEKIDLITKIESKIYDILEPYLGVLDEKKLWEVYGIGSKYFYEENVYTYDQKQTNLPTQTEGSPTSIKKRQNQNDTPVKPSNIEERKTANTQSIHQFDFNKIDENIQRNPSKIQEKKLLIQNFPQNVEVTPFLKRTIERELHACHHIIIIFTTKVFSDFQKALEEIILKQKFPFSTIVIGVGQQDFSQFEALNMQYLGGYTDRNITKFLKCPNMQAFNDPTWLDSILQQIPEQYLDLMHILDRYATSQ